MYRLIISIVAFAIMLPGQMILAGQASDSKEAGAWRNDMAAFAAEVLVVARQSTDPDEAQLLLAKQFIGKVRWSGRVQSTKFEEEKKQLAIEIAFPVPSGAPSYLKFRHRIQVRIPFSEIDRDKVPKTGDKFSFTGLLKTQKTNEIFESGWVFYSVGVRGGGHLLGVSLTEAAPAPVSDEKDLTESSEPSSASRKSGWDPKISSVNVRDEYSERDLFSNKTIYEIRPVKPDLELAVISIRFQTPHVTPEQSQSKLKEYESLLPKEAYAFLSEPLEANGALLASSDLNVVWDNGETAACMAFKLTYFLTHAQSDGSKLLIRRMSNLQGGDGQPLEPSLLRQLRIGDGDSYFWYTCGRSLGVTSIFPIPKHAKSGKLNFCGEVLPVELAR
ncbi:MAG: hypothetical protein GMKNLPBB_02913 [Myxococcota bacterium]|nr:hypothetical protein [Myxococcota bacterium]